jgi:acetyltransferase/esterase
MFRFEHIGMASSYPTVGPYDPTPQVTVAETSHTATVRVPGASLHYEIRGAGPVLLLIHAGNGDIFPFERMAQALADRYQVISYVRRGFVRSPLDGVVDDGRRLDADGEEADSLLDQLADGPVYVFGSSSGAIVALELLARYPELAEVLTPGAASDDGGVL